MKILDNLKKVFEANFKEVFTGNTFNLFAFSKITNVFLEKDGEKLLINLKKADENQKQQVKKILDESRENDEEGFLTKRNITKTKKIKKNLPKEKDKGLLNFYKEKISDDIYEA